MCTIILVRDRVAEFPLVMAANRDEFRERPWIPPAIIEGELRIVAPRDEEAGGTWIGLNSAGLVLAVTNRMFTARETGRRSRGLLAVDVLGAPSVAEARARIRGAVEKEPYNGFNFIVADRRESWVMIQGESEIREVQLTGDVHIITSMHDLDPEMLAPVAERVRAAAVADLDGFVAGVRPILGDRTKYPDRYAICQLHGPYGTVSSSVIGLGAGGARFEFAPGPPDEEEFAPQPTP